MGLDCSHDAWHGAYSAFHKWRKKIAEVAGLPPLELMEGFYVGLDQLGLTTPTLFHGGFESSIRFIDDRLPISWDCLKPNPLYELLAHSDCDGEIEASRCGDIADALEVLIPLLPDVDAGGHIGNWRDKTQQFVDGLRDAYASGEDLRFG